MLLKTRRKNKMGKYKFIAIILIIGFFFLSTGFISDVARKLFDEKLSIFFAELNKGKDLNINNVLDLFTPELIKKWKSKYDSAEEFVADFKKEFLSITKDCEINYIKGSVEILEIRKNMYLIFFDLEVHCWNQEKKYVRFFAGLTLKHQKIDNPKIFGYGELDINYRPPLNI